MSRAKCSLAVALLLLLAARNGLGENVLFEDNFAGGLSDRWQVVGLKKTDCRIAKGGLEVRVQPGQLGRETPMRKVVLPFTSDDTVVASVKVTLLNEFTRDREFAGVYLLDEKGLEFGAKKERIDGKLVFSPGNYDSQDKPDQEGGAGKLQVKYRAATPEAGPLRIIVDRGDAFFQVGPSAEGKYLNFFFSAIRPSKQRGFCLVATGAPEGAEHWVRYEAFRVVRQRGD